ncbi:BamA/TamA family outer membrane protein [Hymenobacter sp. HMF4947]|uniref:BamA/TamA family outer membrane protein n=1 Tax=Hymenobacter ginkgonis TaxID=2682976 RepID=A0A7K1TBS9_9BACT|nr:BamA/TamA family outer membrane protein [Hymenobacter ginkgonis]MVN75870.1 BamA/TamA family outer membrane protein [Hymenobacter ginkgonis]
MKHRVWPSFLPAISWLLFSALLGPVGLVRAQTTLPPPSADSLRELSQERHPPPLVPVVAPTDTLVRVAPCPAAGPRVRVSAVLFVGNSTTKERTLLAELDFREGDSLAVAELPARLEANRRRVYNLQLFHTVLVQASCGGTGQLIVLFSLQERWYILPTPIFSLADPNFNRWWARPSSERWQRIDYGLHLTHTNFRGRAEQVTANVQLGFNRKYELFYEAPGFGRRRRVGLGFGISYYQSRNLDYVTLSDRPTPLATPEEDAFPIQRFYVSGGIRLRHTVQLVSAIDVSYHRELISDLIYQLNPNYYLGLQQRQYLELSGLITNNKRNTFAYPLTGQFMQAALSFRQFVGVGALPAYATARLRYARYLSLGHNFYYALGLWAQARLLTDRLAYADARSLGYEALVRGYDNYVVEGRHYGLVQQGLSFRAWAPPPLRIPFINNPKINTLPLAVYLNAFADAGVASGRLGYLPSDTNQLPGQVLASVGLGLHLVTYYDRVFCFELTRTTTGYARTGFFLRSSFPI